MLNQFLVRAAEEAPAFKIVDIVFKFLAWVALAAAIQYAAIKLGEPGLYTFSALLKLLLFYGGMSQVVHWIHLIIPPSAPVRLNALAIVLISILFAGSAWGAFAISDVVDTLARASGN